MVCKRIIYSLFTEDFSCLPLNKTGHCRSYWVYQECNIPRVLIAANRSLSNTISWQHEVIIHVICQEYEEPCLSLPAIPSIISWGAGRVRDRPFLTFDTNNSCNWWGSRNNRMKSTRLICWLYPSIKKLSPMHWPSQRLPTYIHQSTRMPKSLYFHSTPKHSSCII